MESVWDLDGFLWRVKRVGDVPKAEVERMRSLMLSWEGKRVSPNLCGEVEKGLWVEGCFEGKGTDLGTCLEGRRGGKGRELGSCLKGR